MYHRFKNMNFLALFTSRWRMVGTLANVMRSSVRTGLEQIRYQNKKVRYVCFYSPA